MPNVDIITTSDPAAGSELSYTATRPLLIRSVVATLVTSAAVANRVVNIAADDQTNVFFRSAGQAAQTASQTQIYCAAAFGSGANSVIMTLMIPADGVRLRSGDRIRTITQGFDAGDNWGAAIIFAERW